MLKSEVITRLAEFMFELQEKKLTTTEINLSLLEWVLDNGIIIIGPEKEV